VDSLFRTPSHPYTQGLAGRGPQPPAPGPGSPAAASSRRAGLGYRGQQALGVPGANGVRNRLSTSDSSRSWPAYITTTSSRDVCHHTENRAWSAARGPGSRAQTPQQVQNVRLRGWSRPTRSSARRPPAASAGTPTPSRSSTRCRIPPDSGAGTHPGAVGDAHLGEQLRRPLLGAAPGHPAGAGTAPHGPAAPP